MPEHKSLDTGQNSAIEEELSLFRWQRNTEKKKNKLNTDARTYTMHTRKLVCFIAHFHFQSALRNRRSISDSLKIASKPCKDSSSRFTSNHHRGSVWWRIGYTWNWVQRPSPSPNKGCFLNFCLEQNSRGGTFKKNPIPPLQRERDQTKSRNMVDTQSTFVCEECSLMRSTWCCRWNLCGTKKAKKNQHRMWTRWYPKALTLAERCWIIIWLHSLPVRSISNDTNRVPVGRILCLRGTPCYYPTPPTKIRHTSTQQSMQFLTGFVNLIRYCRFFGFTILCSWCHHPKILKQNPARWCIRNGGTEVHGSRIGDRIVCETEL